MSFRNLLLAGAAFLFSTALPRTTEAVPAIDRGSCSSIDEGVECEKSVDDQCCDRWLCLVDFKKKVTLPGS